MAFEGLSFGEKIKIWYKLVGTSFKGLSHHLIKDSNQGICRAIHTTKYKRITLVCVLFSFGLILFSIFSLIICHNMHTKNTYNNT